jgi:hypothetical protein
MQNLFSWSFLYCSSFFLSLFRLSFLVVVLEIELQVSHLLSKCSTITHCFYWFCVMVTWKTLLQIHFWQLCPYHKETNVAQVVDISFGKFFVWYWYFFIFQSHLIYLFIFGKSGVLTLGFILAKQVFYCLSHTSSPFFSG